MKAKIHVTPEQIAAWVATGIKAETGHEPCGKVVFNIRKGYDGGGDPRESSYGPALTGAEVEVDLVGDTVFVNKRR